MHRLASLTSTGLGTVAYGYDDYGKLTTITRGSTTYSLTYDAWNRPISTKVGTTALSTNTYDSDFRLSTVTYANGGALGACLETISYGYDAAHQDWADQLTSYNGEAIRYDDSGNPISYRGYTMAWQGKRLTSATKTGTAITYSYDENGIRTQKTVNGVSTNYYYNGSVLISQVSGNDTLLFSYDASGSVVSVNFNGTDYYYVRNGQGDVIKLIDGNGATVTEYTYDTWGKLLSCTGSLSATLGTLNPFRYRGYVYDNETGFYYLQSRYYDPEVCRFLSADVLLSTGQGVLGHNMFAYCRNNPISRVDVTGHSDEETDEPDEPDGPDVPDIYDLIRGNIILAIIVRGASLLAIRYPVVLCGSRLGWFYFLVKKDGPMDYKNQDRWKSALPNLEYPGDDGEEDKYWFYGEKRSASDLGNINYGAVGAALGIPLWILLQQAGAAHRRDHMGDGFIESQFNSLKKGTGEHFGDEWDDYYNIKLGYRLYMEGYFCDE